MIDIEARQRTVILRTPAEKAHVALTWDRPDPEFFASGACHILAGAFLRVRPDAGFACFMVRPTKGDRGRHVVVMDARRVFDWMGYTDRGGFLDAYTSAMAAVIPGWTGSLEPVEGDPLGWDFCHSERHRHPSQFLHDPVPRALTHVRRFPAPATGM